MQFLIASYTDSCGFSKWEKEGLFRLPVVAMSNLMPDIKHVD